MSRLGLALSATAVTLADGSTWPLAPRMPGEGDWPALREACDQILRQQRTSSRVAAVALMPDLAPLRTVRLPKLRQADALAIVGRSVTRYFPAVREPQAIAIERVTRAEGADRAYVYAVSAVAAGIIAAIERALGASGWTVEHIVPAYAAWAVTGRGVVTVARDAGGTDAFQIRRGVPYEVRRSRSGESAAARVDIASAAMAAARLVPRARRLPFRTPGVVAERGQRLRTRAAAVAAAMVGVAAVAIAVVWWRAHAELRHIEVQRTALAPRVAVVMREQSASIALTNPAQALARVEEHGVRWSQVFADLADNLPDDAHIESLRATGDSLSIDAAAGNGAHAVSSVVKNTALTAVGASGPIRRDVPADSSAAAALERFTVTARVPGAAVLVPPPPKKAVVRQ